MEDINEKIYEFEDPNLFPLNQHQDPDLLQAYEAMQDAAEDNILPGHYNVIVQDSDTPEDAKYVDDLSDVSFLYAVFVNKKWSCYIRHIKGEIKNRKKDAEKKMTTKYTGVWFTHDGVRFANDPDHFAKIHIVNNKLHWLRNMQYVVFDNFEERLRVDKFMDVEDVEYLIIDNSQLNAVSRPFMHTQNIKWCKDSLLHLRINLPGFHLAMPESNHFLFQHLRAFQNLAKRRYNNPNFDIQCSLFESLKGVHDLRSFTLNFGNLRSRVMRDTFSDAKNGTYPLVNIWQHTKEEEYEAQRQQYLEIKHELSPLHVAEAINTVVPELQGIAGVRMLIGQYCVSSTPFLYLEIDE